MEYDFLSNIKQIKWLNCKFQENFVAFYFLLVSEYYKNKINLIKILSVSMMGKCPVKPGHI